MPTSSIKPYDGIERRAEARRMLNGLKKEDQVCAFHKDVEKNLSAICKKVDTLKWFVLVNIAIAAPTGLITLLKGIF